MATRSASISSAVRGTADSPSHRYRGTPSMVYSGGFSSPLGKSRNW